MGFFHHMGCKFTRQINFTTIALKNPQPKTIDLTIFQTFGIGELCEILVEKNLVAIKLLLYCSIKLVFFVKLFRG